MVARFQEGVNYSWDLGRCPIYLGLSSRLADLRCLVTTPGGADATLTKDCDGHQAAQRVADIDALGCIEVGPVNHGLLRFACVEQ